MFCELSATQKSKQIYEIKVFLCVKYFIAFDIMPHKVLLFSQILTDLVQGEFMQLGAKETENERFTHYLTKTYRKTASLIANSLKSVSFYV